MGWQSHRDIERLLYRYAKYVDSAQWGELGRLFTHAEVRTSSGGEVVRGAAAVVDQWSSFNKVHADGTLRTRHLVTNVMIEIDESAGTAGAESYFMSFQATDRLPLQPIVGGRYRDRFRRARTHRCAQSWCGRRGHRDRSIGGDARTRARTGRHAGIAKCPVRRNRR